jgi:pimeloyl-ACP methyl ester carboxylesterase
VHDVLGHRRCAVAGGDIGGVVGVDLVHRFDDFVERLCFFNTVPPAALEQYAAAGMDYGSLSALSDGPTGDYRELQGARPDELAAMLPTPEARRQWVAGMYQSRLWASPGTFGRADVDFMTEPFADADRLRASWGSYETAYGNRPMEDVPKLFEPCPVPALVLYGPEDAVVPPSFPDRARVAFTECVGPFVVPDAGHFLQWEQADVLNRALAHFCR